MATVVGTSGADRLVGTAGADVIVGLGGGDTIEGRDGGDLICAGGGTDKVYGGNGDDRADGGVGADRLYGQSGKDRLLGAGGDDWLMDSLGSDELLGGTGDDFSMGGQQDDLIHGGGGTDTVMYREGGSVTVDLANGVATRGAEVDIVHATENVIGGRRDDELIGSSGANVLDGGHGKDIIAGGAGDDSLLGNSAPDVLLGQTGDDLLEPSGGNDTVDGGEGIDTVDFTGETYGVTVNLEQGTARNRMSRDEVASVETVLGSVHDDVLVGSSGADELRGASGFDVLVGQGGDDDLQGGPDVDWARYPGTIAVTVDLAAGTAQRGDETDDLAAVEGVTGSDAGDSLTGSDGDDHLDGRSGLDALVGAGGNDHLDGGNGEDSISGDSGADVLFGGPGADEVDGGDDEDIASFTAATTGVVADLQAGTATSEGSTDTLTTVEDITGTTFPDVLEGDEGPNVLRGLTGTDGLLGQGGSDSLHGDEGDDVLSGGAADDFIEGGDGTDKARFDDAGAVTVDLAAHTATRLNENDEVATVESVQGSPFADVLRGNGLANVLEGAAGDDTLVGRGGDDQVAGGAGADTVEGGVDRDTVDGGEHNDTLTGGPGNDLLIGATGDDDLQGSAGTDELIGGFGTDTGDGGLEWDTCTLENPAHCELVRAETMPPLPPTKLAPVAVPAEPAGTVTPLPDGPAVAYQMNVRHSGTHDDGSRAATGLTHAWTQLAGYSLSYPLIADGNVYATIAEPSGPYGTNLVALDATSGNELWRKPLGGVYYIGGLTYEDGFVYTLNHDGVVAAFNGATGDEVWSVQLLGQWSFDAAPTVADGVVYVTGQGSGDTLYAIDTTTGIVLWARAGGASHSSPTISHDSVFTGGACNEVYRHSRSGGGVVWTFRTGCSGGGGKTTVFADGLLFTRDSNGNLVMEADTARVVARHDSRFAPAVLGDRGFFVDSVGDLVARDVPSMTPRWTFHDVAPIVTAPMYVNGVVYVGTSSGQFLGIRASDGLLLWRDTISGGLHAPDEHNAHQLKGMAAGEGMIVIATPNGLRAYASATLP